MLYRKSYLMILCRKSKIWSVFSIWGPFLGFLEAIFGHFEACSSSLSKNRGISEKNENFHFFPVRAWEWLRWVALVKILIVRRFLAHYIICLLLKKCIFWIFRKKNWFSQMCQSRCSRPREMAISWVHPIFCLKKSVLEPQTQKGAGERTLKISKNWFQNLAM